MSRLITYNEEALGGATVPVREVHGQVPHGNDTFISIPLKPKIALRKPGFANTGRMFFAGHVGDRLWGSDSKSQVPPAIARDGKAQLGAAALGSLLLA